MQGKTPDTEVPRWGRGFVAAFLAVFVICGLVGIEAWPLTGWQLFSRSRPERALAFEAVAVVGDGAERTIPFERMPYGYRGYVQVLGEFQALAADDRAAVCRAWAGGAEPLLGPVSAVRVYRTEVHLARRDGRRGVPPSRSLVEECVR